MPVPGYDPEDIDEELEAELTEGEVRERLSDEEFERYENGESLFELLEGEQIDEILTDE